MADPTKAEMRHGPYGETSQEMVNRMAGSGTDGGAHGPTLVPRGPAPQNIHPSAKGVYGSPVGDPILTGGK